MINLHQHSQHQLKPASPVANHHTIAIEGKESKRKHDLLSVCGITLVCMGKPREVASDASAAPRLLSQATFFFFCYSKIIPPAAAASPNLTMRPEGRS